MLDRHVPYGELFGIPDIPKARYFQNGKYFDREGNSIDAEQPGPGVSEAYSLWHWRKLKAAVQEAGGEWKSKDDAIAFLTRLDKGEETENELGATA